jgi:hypothetical protein
MATVRSRPALYKRVRVNPVEEKARVGMASYVLMLIIVPVFVLGLVFVKLNSDQVKLKRQLSEMRRDFGLRSKELANLDLEVEMYRNGSRIFSQIQRLGLGLRMPERGQVVRVRGGAEVPQRRSQDHSGAELANAEREG